tara:strand:+ start:264 stop:524 length:261 start_codon:yes stop_codon:yes gene_type:complete
VLNKKGDIKLSSKKKIIGIRLNPNEEKRVVDLLEALNENGKDEFKEWNTSRFVRALILYATDHINGSNMGQKPMINVMQDVYWDVY